MLNVILFCFLVSDLSFASKVYSGIRVKLNNEVIKSKIEKNIFINKIEQKYELTVKRILGQNPPGQNPRTKPPGQYPAGQNPPMDKSSQNPPGQNPPGQNPLGQNPPDTTPRTKPPPPDKTRPDKTPPDKTPPYVYMYIQLQMRYLIASGST